MVYYEDAKLLDAMDLKKMIATHYCSPSVDRMIFMELNGRNGNSDTLLPCYMEAWTEDESSPQDRPDGRKWLMFKCTVIVYKDEMFTSLPIFLHEKEFRDWKRVWDKPPADSVRKSHPFVESQIQ